MFIDEELEILEIINSIKEKNISFKILKKEKSRLKTRRQLKEENFIHNELKNMNSNKLSYIYFECFNKRENNKKIIINELEKIPVNSKTYKTLYDILKLTATSKNK